MPSPNRHLHEGAVRGMRNDLDRRRRGVGMDADDYPHRMESRGVSSTWRGFDGGWSRTAFHLSTQGGVDDARAAGRT